ncbi:hypothetical protein B296_00011597 [Ensete ventricosum]|uniref:RRM domain-containing protein n=1 Tax=Ensete ventricosum TaxID=4639 RepID=A0A426ZGW3_ENSVE|nr:hypothetical protein B296_00011597 [Ensete ventricosum]
MRIPTVWGGMVGYAGAVPLFNERTPPMRRMHLMRPLTRTDSIPSPSSIASLVSSCFDPSHRTSSTLLSWIYFPEASEADFSSSSFHFFGASSLERTVFVDIDAFGEGRGASRGDERDGVRIKSKGFKISMVSVVGLGGENVDVRIPKMPRTRASAAAAAANPEPANPAEPEEQVALDDPEEMMEEEIEYEEVEEEVEEEEEEVVEEEIEEELEEEEQETDVANGSNAGDAAGGDASMVEGEKDDDESKKHAELLALPPHGSEIYVGGIPHDASEEELRSFCEPIGEVTEVKYQWHCNAFQGKKVKCSTSQVKHRLFIGNIPRNWAEDDLKRTVTSIGPGIIKVELLKNYHISCILAEFLQVKAIYVKNLPKNVTQEQLKKLFEHHGEITKVVLPPAKAGHEKRYGFVHFKERSMAMKALKNTEKYEIDGDTLCYFSLHFWLPKAVYFLRAVTFPFLV